MLFKVQQIWCHLTIMTICLLVIMVILYSEYLHWALQLNQIEHFSRMTCVILGNDWMQHTHYHVMEVYIPQKLIGLWILTVLQNQRLQIFHSSGCRHDTNVCYCSINHPDHMLVAVNDHQWKSMVFHGILWSFSIRHNIVTPALRKHHKTKEEMALIFHAAVYPA